MAATTLQVVRRASPRMEALAVASAVVLIVLLLGLWAQRRVEADATAPLHDWQVSAFETLTGPDQAIYNALYTAKDEIVYLYDDLNMFNPPGKAFRWPAISDLEESLLPPFYRDGSWQQNGSLQWRLHEPLSEGEMQGSVMYLGTDGTAAGQGSFLLVIGHVHAGFTNSNSIVIWWNPATHVAMPQSGFNDSLILKGWREVVPHSGAAEVRRIYGDDAPESVEDAASADALVDDLFGPAP